MADESVQGHRVVINKDRMKWFNRHGLQWDLELQLNERAHTVNLIQMNDRQKPVGLLLGIYKLEGETLTICLGWGTTRPTEMVKDAGTKQPVYVLKRLTD